MEELKIQIELDPVNDRIIQFPGNARKIKSDISNPMALVVGTDSNFRTVSTRELDRMLEALGDDGLAYSLCDDYAMVFSSKAIVYTEFGNYLVGSAVFMKTGRDSRIKELSDLDIKAIRTLFERSLVKLSCASVSFKAFPLEHDYGEAA